MFTSLLIGKLIKRTEATRLKIIKSSLDSLNGLLCVLPLPFQSVCQQLRRNYLNVLPLPNCFVMKQCFQFWA